MSGESHTTTDHETIRKWAEERDGRPAHVKGTGEGADDPGVLRIELDSRQDSLDTIEWDAFFQKFDESRLAFLYQDRTKDGKLSRFFKIISRD